VDNAWRPSVPVSMVRAMSDLVVTFPLLNGAARAVLVQRAAVDAAARSLGPALRLVAAALPRSHVADEIERLDRLLRGVAGTLGDELAGIAAALARAAEAYRETDGAIARRATDPLPRSIGTRWAT